MKVIYFTLIAISLIGCALYYRPTSRIEFLNSKGRDSIEYGELYRPGFHFTPPKNWMNDPNGLVYFEDEYHLFYQYNPEGDQWGHMSWGHAVSKDLTHWENLPLALPEYDGWMIFSGSAVADSKNTSGFCTSSKGCLVAMFTASASSRQAQSLAYSNDKGRTWTYYAGNPVIDEKLADFRDPKVFWHEPSQKWIVSTVLATQYQIRFYSSPDLIHWTRLSEFGPDGLTQTIWECPDLFQMTIEGTNETKWILSFSYYTDRARIAYFIGDFDGVTFKETNPSSPFTQFMEDGRDYYAAVTWNNVPDGRRLAIGWAGDWSYLAVTPTAPWKGVMSFVRELTLKNTSLGLRIKESPVRELEALRVAQAASYKNVRLDSERAAVVDSNVTGAQLEINVTFSFEKSADVPKEFGLKVFAGENQETLIGYDVGSQSLYIDRTNSGVTSFHSDFPDRVSTKFLDNQGKLSLHILVDQSIVEVFDSYNAVAMTDLIFPDPSKAAVQFYVVGGKANVDSFDAWVLKSTW